MNEFINWISSDLLAFSKYMQVNHFGVMSCGYDLTSHSYFQSNSPSLGQYDSRCVCVCINKCHDRKMRRNCIAIHLQL